MFGKFEKWLGKLKKKLITLIWKLLLCYLSSIDFLEPDWQTFCVQNCDYVIFLDKQNNLSVKL